jgi:spore germination protein GerM
MRMKHRRNIWTGGLILLGIALAALIYAHRGADTGDSGKDTPAGAHKVSHGNAKHRVHLYFSDEDGGYLAAEERVLSLPEDIVGKATTLVQALIRGPETSLRPTIPEKTDLLAVYVTHKGIAYVDFDDTIRREHPGGTFAELLTIFSVVNTLCLNVPDVYAVKILIGGREQKTLSGHIDIERPLKANLLMLKG